MFSTIAKLRWQVKAIIGAIVVGGIIYAVSGTEPGTAGQATHALGAPAGSDGGFFGRIADAVGGDSGPDLNVCINTWGGFAGAQWFNGGFEPSPESRFTKEYGISVRFEKQDVFDTSRAAFANGQCDLVWGTVDSYPTEAESLQASQARSPFQVDWSRGGDAIVAVRGINSVNDLKGRSIGVAFGTPSHSLLLWLLNSANISTKEVKIVQMKDAIDVATAFKAGQLDAGVVWSPDDEDCVKAVAGSKVVVSTKQATDIIADHLLVKHDTIVNKKAALVALYKGWMKGNVEVATNQRAFDEAVQITAAGYGMPPEFMALAIRNVRLTTHGDNKNFYGLTAGYSGVKAEELYTRTGMLYQEQGFIGGFPSWRAVVDTAIITAADAELGTAATQKAENATTFAAPTPAIARAEAISAKPVTVSFPVNGWTLDDVDKDVIDKAVLPLAKQFRSSYIRIEGNTDSTGAIAANVKLSALRAASVADYLEAQHSFPRERFVTQGNGPGKPACDELYTTNIAACRAQNRRTEFQVLAEAGQ